MVRGFEARVDRDTESGSDSDDSDELVFPQDHEDESSSSSIENQGNHLMKGYSSCNQRNISHPLADDKMGNSDIRSLAASVLCLEELGREEVDNASSSSAEMIHERDCEEDKATYRIQMEALVKNGQAIVDSPGTMSSPAVSDTSEGSAHPNNQPKVDHLQQDLARYDRVL